MFRIKWFIVSFLAIFLVVGCGQQVPEVNIKSGQPEGLSVNGQVYVVIAGSSSPNLDKPIANATVALSGVTTQTTTTDASGKYVFTEVAPGDYTVTVSMEGYQTTTVSDTFLWISDIPDNTVLTMSNVALYPLVKINTINVYDEQAPGSDRIEITFSRSMDKETLVTDLVYSGARIMSVSGGVAIDQSWDTDNKILTITPRDGFAEGAMYSLRLRGQDGLSSGIKDLERNPLLSMPPEGSGFIAFNSDYYGFYVGIFTGAPAATIPGAPTNLAAKVRSSSANGAIDFKDVNYAYSESVYLSWDEVAEAVAYKVYASYDGGPYQYVSSYTNANTGDGSLTALTIDNALTYFARSNSGSSYPSAAQVLPWPYLGKGIDFKITAVNAAGESPFSDVINVNDNVFPEVIAVENYSLTQKRVYFTEPLDFASAQTLTNYIMAGQTVTAAVLTNTPEMYNSVSGVYYGSYVTLTITPGTLSGTVEVGAAVTDVTGNIINETKDSGTF